MRSLVALSIGCPAGIGPEVAVVAAEAAPKHGPQALLVGDPDVIAEAMKVRDIASKRMIVVDDPEEAREVRKHAIVVWSGSKRLSRLPRPGAPGPADGDAQLAWVDQATDLVVAKKADALVTGPVSKAAIASCGVAGAETFRGHTEHLQARLGATEVVMAFWSPVLTVGLVTTHISLAAVPSAIDAEGVSRATYWVARLVRDLGRRKPRIVVCALNPHAGEGGLLGIEEQTTLARGIERARARLAEEELEATVDGPVGAESALRRSIAGKRDRAHWDAAVAMYHDQATIASKVASFGEAVNVSLGLPIIRTSVDHGTGYDLAGKGTADEGGMAAAIELAGKLIDARD
jgi:4-hydroxythreonine-4-phosphate dehydrogenase